MKVSLLLRGTVAPEIAWRSCAAACLLRVLLVERLLARVAARLWASGSLAGFCVPGLTFALFQDQPPVYVSFVPLLIYILRFPCDFGLRVHHPLWHVTQRLLFAFLTLCLQFSLFVLLAQELECCVCLLQTAFTSIWKDFKHSLGEGNCGPYSYIFHTVLHFLLKESCCYCCN